MTRSIFLFFCISEIATAKSLSPQSQEGSFQSLPQILLESDPKPEGPACDIKTRGNSLLFFSEHLSILLTDSCSLMGP